MRELPLAWVERVLDLMGIPDAADDKQKQNAGISLHDRNLEVKETRLAETFDGAIAMRRGAVATGMSGLFSSRKLAGTKGKAGLSDTVEDSTKEGVSEVNLNLIKKALDVAEQDSPQAINHLLVLLRRLELLPVTLALLEATGIGRSLTSLKKRVTHVEVRREASGILASWKALVAAGPQGAAGVAVRAQGLIANALKTDHKGGEADLKALALAIDLAIWGKIGAPQDTEDEKVRARYKSAMMTLVSNLQRRENTDLRLRILSGELVPDELAGMDANALAIPSVKAEREKKAAATKDMLVQMVQRCVDGYDKTRPCNECGEYKCITQITQSCGAAHAHESIPDAIYHCQGCGHRFTTND